MTPRATQSRPAPHVGFSLISGEMLLRLHRSMVESRLLARRFGKDWGLRPGSEAMLAGVLLTLEPRDAVQPGARRPLAEHLRGRALKRALQAAPAAEPAAAARARAAVARARRLKAAGRGAALVALTGGPLDPAWLRALATAAAERLPLLLVSECRVSECRAAALADPLANTVAGVPRLPVDAGDAVAVFRVATECLAHARRGNGPSLIECEHLPGGKGRGPVGRMEEYLLRKGLFQPRASARLRTAFLEAIRHTPPAATR